MKKRELNEEEIKLLQYAEMIFGVPVEEVYEFEKGYIFLIKKELLGKAVGKNGENVRAFKEKTGKNAYLLAYAEDIEDFIRGCYHDIEILAIKEDGNDVYVFVREKDRGIAIGKEGERIKAIKKVTQEKFGKTTHIRIFSELTQK